MVSHQEATCVELFLKVTRAITSSLNPDEIFELITRKIPEVVGVDACTIRLLDASRKKLQLKAAHGLSEAYLNRGPIDTEEPIFVALKGDPIVIEDAARDSRIQYQEATESEGIRNILVPFDFSVHSKKALEEAMDIARTFGSKIRVLHVIEDRFHPAFYGPFFQSIYDLDPAIEEKTLHHLEEEIEPYEHHGIEIKLEALRGYPGTEIAHYADKHDVDLIVMSTHGLTGLALLTLGSVAARTVSMAHCPVLTLRREAIVEEEEDTHASEELEEV